MNLHGYSHSNFNPLVMDNEDKLVFQKLCEVSPVSIEVIDIRHDELICASGWTSNYLGYSEEEYETLSRNLFEKIVHPQDRPVQLAAFQYLREHPQIPFKEFSLRVLRKDGKYSHLLVRLTVLELAENKKPETILSTVMDIEEVVKLREQLDEQLKKMDVISFKNSHELRGPVASILGLIQLIEHERFDGSHSMEIISCLKKTVIKLDKVVHEINQNTY